ncbi:3-hydroxyacyl-CoA dehydrogenase family protein [Amycolatopsis sp. BJA-103]|uniref:3-hydroxyacyl-CoA dehydrogenase family protein n=1 Tax=Amycolatopsis sp. BJA-103 TaxID=1911175 RepID=UPI000C7708DC|nr:3-hydroxyacyl-CoA dehydrogenase family protein [Amycolatopsis sp. BJA-103]AUI58394.1 3-hydroxyacyl-CoA dehydrogenase [Amycolatopsis sp. BJA-103]PNE13404.1 3-hydroxyacyl-CoA dehydrogenase [Amycolatopsis sp. BJA-103]
MTTAYEDHRLAVIGAGVMGTNISTLALGHGVPVVLVDIDESVLDTAKATIAQKTRHAQLMGVLPDRPTAGLTTSTSLSSIADATTVVEAVTEVAEVKEKVLAEASRIVAPGTTLISNTSCIPIDEMAAWTARPEELVGVHFMNPSYLIKMVEVIRGPRTAPAVLDNAVGLLSVLGRESLVIEDSAGFVINRLLHPLINTAAMLVEEGVASVEVVDGLLEGCLGHSTGPLRTGDLIGLENLVDSLNVLYERRGDESCRPCDLLLQKVADGHLGRKTGRGFYDYGKVAS